LAHDFSKLVNGESYRGIRRSGDDWKDLSLAMVPAFIPEGFSGEQTRGVWRLIDLVWSYRFIFGAQRDESATRQSANVPKGTSIGIPTSAIPGESRSLPPLLAR
jgi:hypothetical protein